MPSEGVDAPRVLFTHQSSKQLSSALGPPQVELHAGRPPLIEAGLDRGGDLGHAALDQALGQAEGAEPLSADELLATGPGAREEHRRRVGVEQLRAGVVSGHGDHGIGVRNGGAQLGVELGNLHALETRGELPDPLGPLGVREGTAHDPRGPARLAPAQRAQVGLDAIGTVATARLRLTANFWNCFIELPNIFLHTRRNERT